MKERECLWTTKKALRPHSQQSEATLRDNSTNKTLQGAPRLQMIWGRSTKQLKCDESTFILVKRCV